MNPAREEILNRLKNAVHAVPEKPDFEKPVFHPIDKSLDEAFKESLEMVNGFVFSFASEEKMYQGLKDFFASRKEGLVFCSEKQISEKLDLVKINHKHGSEIPKDMEFGITGCEYLVAHTGSVLVSSAQQGGRQMFVFPPVHVVIAKKNQLVATLEQAYSNIGEKYQDNFPSQFTLITGPSRTADIEKTMVLGAHGPRELIVFLSE
jgi:L-lactate dehydrogenase complex protein LldG